MHSAPTPPGHDGLADIRREIHRLADPERAAVLQRFFKTEPGQYGEGDRFLGVRVPELRRLAKAHRDLPLGSTLDLLRSPWHEERLVALLVMVDTYRRGSDDVRNAIHRAYLDHAAHVNSWDLVDASAEHILGSHVDPDEPALLDQLTGSVSVWKRRMAIMATFRWIKGGVFEPTLRMAELLIDDPHSLIHKAVGWMLREVGKRDVDRLEQFLQDHYQAMPRTMLRYAIERLPEPLRQAYLRGEA